MPTQRDTSSYWVKDMRERRYLTFDMENPRHQKAFELYTAQSGKLRSEYVVDCILKVQHENRLEKILRQIIKEELKNVPFSVTAYKSKSEDLHTTDKISELPEALLSSLDDI